MTSMIRKLSAPLMLGQHLSGEAEDAFEAGVVSGLSGLAIGFASAKIGSRATPFALIAAGALGDVGSMYIGLKSENRHTMRAVSDTAIAVGFAQVGASIAKGAGLRASMTGELETSSGFGMLETSSSFGADSRDQMTRAAADL